MNYYPHGVVASHGTPEDLGVQIKVSAPENLAYEESLARVTERMGIIARMAS